MSKKSKLYSWFNKPFPSYLSIKQKISIPVYFGIFVSAFLYIFQPFGIETNNLLYVVIYGITTTLIMLFFSIIFPLFFPKFSNEDKWNVHKHIIYVFLHILFIGLANSIIAYFFQEDLLENSLFVIIFIAIAQTFAIGVFPVFVLTFWLERKLMKQHQEIAKNTSDKLKSKTIQETQKIKISSQNQKEIIETNTENLICIKAEGNYCKIFIENKKIEKKVMRVTMKKIEDDLSKLKNIVRCHKSFFVNLDKINDVTGNARGYFFLIDELDFSIPVSRNFSKNLFDNIMTT